MKTYTTKQGDMWDAIAFEQCGSTDKTDALMKLNMKHSGTFIFLAGITLTLPDEDADTDNTVLPPWKQVSK